jgi:hypothetical protein
MSRPFQIRAAFEDLNSPSRSRRIPPSEGLNSDGALSSLVVGSWTSNQFALVILGNKLGKAQAVKFVLLVATQIVLISSRALDLDLVGLVHLWQTSQFRGLFVFGLFALLTAALLLAHNFGSSDKQLLKSYRENPLPPRLACRATVSDPPAGSHSDVREQLTDFSGTDHEGLHAVPTEPSSVCSQNRNAYITLRGIFTKFRRRELHTAEALYVNRKTIFEKNHEHHREVPRQSSLRETRRPKSTGRSLGTASLSVFSSLGHIV